MPSPKKRQAKKKPSSDENATTALAVIPKTGVGRKCSICFHPDVKKINAAIGKGDSFRDISGQFDISKSSVGRHAENCLKLDIYAAFAEKRIDEAVEHYQELNKQRKFAMELQEACRELLTDSRTGVMTLAPRDYEIDVLYVDWADLNFLTGLPTRKKEKLSDILFSIQQIKSGFQYQQAQIKSINYFDAAIKTIDTIDKLLDKFAKVDGHYQKDKENDETLNRVVGAFKSWLSDPANASLDRKHWLKLFAQNSNVDVKRLAERVGVEIE